MNILRALRAGISAGLNKYRRMRRQQQRREHVETPF
jgi:hypothetical protein